jgi:hypothetical protein
MVKKYEVTKSCHKMNCIEAVNLPVEELKRLTSIVLCNIIDSVEYKACKKAGAFLQGYDESSGWILIEFWNEDYQDFMTLANRFVEMTKNEAIEVMKRGFKVRHKYFSEDEWMTYVNNYTIMTEEGYEHNAEMFWRMDRNGKEWDKGYYLV